MENRPPSHALTCYRALFSGMQITTTSRPLPGGGQCVAIAGMVVHIFSRVSPVFLVLSYRDLISGHRTSVVFQGGSDL